MSRRASDGVRGLIIRLLIYGALAIMPVDTPLAEFLPQPRHAIVQPWGPVPDIDDLVAELAFRQ